MDYTNLTNNTTGKTSKVGIIGATRGYDYALLAQIPKVKRMDLRVICSRYPEECLEVLKEIRYDEDQIIFCEGKPEIEQAPSEAILIVSGYRLVMEYGVTALVECTGNMTASSDAALAAPRAGVNVYMVSKETDSVCGPLLNQVAAEYGAVYALVNGDQLCNLLDLHSWAMLLGLEVMVAGESSEYDFMWNRETGEFTCTDGDGVVGKIPQMQDCWYYSDVETPDQRRSILEKHTGVISADLCEMNLVFSITGLVPSSPFLSYPVAKTSELTNIFIPEEDGGVLKETGVVDVFYNPRGKDEVSFYDGEFVIVRYEDEKA